MNKVYKGSVSCCFILPILFCFMVTLSCKKEEEKLPKVPEELFGRWNMVEGNFYEVIDEEIIESSKEPYDEDDYEDIEFFRNGTITFYVSGTAERKRSAYHFRVSEDGKKLFLSNDDDDEIITAEIRQLNTTGLTIGERGELDSGKDGMLVLIYEKHVN